jgi:hypothetical protein
MLMDPRRWWLHIKERLLPARRVVVVDGDDLPAKLPIRQLVLLRDGDEDWSVTMRCPCGCGQRIELPLLPEVRPRWSLRVDEHRRPTLHPSVWLKEGCRSHFLLRAGKVIWV